MGYHGVLLILTAAAIDAASPLIGIQQFLELLKLVRMVEDRHVFFKAGRTLNH